ncbi:TPA: hypothetical protein DF272_02780 [Candidatus Falkowbacteria bacterium]|nr:hypothetical protein [Candidatus Falkowbacteria bacterium]
MKRVFIVHGWDSSPTDAWFPWLKTKLQGPDCKVIIPSMPDSDAPRINKWVPALGATVGMVDDETYFIGHSMGCQAILRYLESLPDDKKIGGAIFVAGFITRLDNLEDDETVRDVAREWLQTPLDISQVKKHLPKSVAIFSDNDRYVSLDNQKNFIELGSELMIVSGKGHFNGEEDKVLELPEVLAAFESILNK